MTINSPIYKNAILYDLNPELVGALVYTESGGNPWAIRYEPLFYKKYIGIKTDVQLQGYCPPSSICSITTERKLRACSFGLFQIMGQTARENNCELPILTMLLDPSNNAALGCKLVRKWLEASNGDVRAMLLRYNGGGNASYPDLVLNNISNGNWQLVYSAD